MGVSGKNAVVVIAVGKSKKWDISKITIERYCKRYNIPLIIISDKKYNIKKYEHFTNFNFFEKNRVYDLFDQYDRILRLDWDVIVTPNCPNLFDIVPENKIGVLLEDVGSRLFNRRYRIRMIQRSLGEIGWKQGYINTGVVLASKMHREIFKTTIEDMEMMEKVNLKISKEQNFFNYSVWKSGFQVFPLDFKFNHISIFSEPWNNYVDKFNSYILHYAGMENPVKMMLKDFNYIFFKRKKPWNLNSLISFKKYRNTIKQFVKYTKEILLDNNSPLKMKKKDLTIFIRQYLKYLKYW